MNTRSRQFRSRAATRETVQAAALRHAVEHGEACNVYRVSGGYEARPVDLGPPKGSHVLLERVDVPPKKQKAAGSTPSPKPPTAPKPSPKPPSPKPPSTPPPTP